MKNIFYFGFLVVIFLTGCSSLEVVNIKDCDHDVSNYQIYFLPKNIIKIDIETNERLTHKGPYCQFADKFLGIKDAPIDDNIQFSISDIKISVLSEPDSNRMFLINPGRKNFPGSLNLTGNGILESINGDIVSIPLQRNDEEISNISIARNDEILFTNLSVKKYFQNHVDTSYKLVQRDSIFVNVPVLNSKVVNKTLADKAEEMSNVILNLREERISLISGDNNNFPAGDAAKKILEEYDKLEMEYLSLFIGKSQEYKHKYTFYFVPEMENVNKTDTLCFFSKKSGISSTKKSGFSPVVVGVMPEGIINPLINFKKNFDKKNGKGIYYIQPDMATINIYSDQVLLSAKKTPISQFGVLNLIPANMIKKNDVKIIFNPLFGTLQSIENK